MKGPLLLSLLVAGLFVIALRQTPARELSRTLSLKHTAGASAATAGS
jgi:hypothetical protein